MHLQWCISATASARLPHSSALKGPVGAGWLAALLQKAASTLHVRCSAVRSQSCSVSLVVEGTAAPAGDEWTSWTTQDPAQRWRKAHLHFSTKNSIFEFCSRLQENFMPGVSSKHMLLHKSFDESMFPDKKTAFTRNSVQHPYSITYL